MVKIFCDGCGREDGFLIKVDRNRSLDRDICQTCAREHALWIEGNILKEIIIRRCQEPEFAHIVETVLTLEFPPKPVWL